MLSLCSKFPTPLPFELLAGRWNLNSVWRNECRTDSRGSNGNHCFMMTPKAPSVGYFLQISDNFHNFFSLLFFFQNWERPSYTQVGDRRQNHLEKGVKILINLTTIVNDFGKCLNLNSLGYIYFLKNDNNHKNVLFLCVCNICFLKCLRSENMDLWNMRKLNSGARKDDRVETTLSKNERTATAGTLVHCCAQPASGSAWFTKSILPKRLNLPLILRARESRGKICRHPFSMSQI